jgi:hypothetical protein
MTKIGVLIPSTSKGRDWESWKQSYLYTLTLKTFLSTYDQEHSYVFYIGIDRGDRIYDSESTKTEAQRFMSIMKNTSIEFIYMDDVKKGHLTRMWNILFKKAYDDGCDYFFQCGDDIYFKTKGWVNDSISVLKSHKNVGMTGPINNNPRILTQSFVSRMHMEILGYYFPEEIINWFCDDWINEVYKNINHFFPLVNHRCDNLGGNPRYDINNDANFLKDFQNNRLQVHNECIELVKRDIMKYKVYI